jgi:hypothetical protein
LGRLQRPLQGLNGDFEINRVVGRGRLQAVRIKDCVDLQHRPYLTAFFWENSESYIIARQSTPGNGSQGRERGTELCGFDKKRDKLGIGCTRLTGERAHVTNLALEAHPECRSIGMKMLHQKTRGTCQVSFAGSEKPCSPSFLFITPGTVIRMGNRRAAHSTPRGGNVRTPTVSSTRVVKVIAQLVLLQFIEQLEHTTRLSSL